MRIEGSSTKSVAQRVPETFWYSVRPIIAEGYGKHLIIVNGMGAYSALHGPFRGKVSARRAIAVMKVVWMKEE